MTRINLKLTPEEIKEEKQRNRKLLTAINLIMQDLTQEDYKKIYRHARAIQKYFENKLLP